MAKIEIMQQNSKCRLCGNRDKMINHIIIECGKLVQKEYEIRLGWVGKIIHGELCKKFRFIQPRIRPGESNAQTSL